MVLKVVSGGQTGIDRAALDAAMSLGLPVGGWCPKGRLSNDGIVPKKYPLKESEFTDVDGYIERTILNIADSDGTLVLTQGSIGTGTSFTINTSKNLKKANMVVDFKKGMIKDNDLCNRYRRKISNWIKKNKIGVLNVAGPSEEKRKGLQLDACDFFVELFKEFKGKR